MCKPPFLFSSTCKPLWLCIQNQCQLWPLLPSQSRPSSSLTHLLHGPPASTLNHGRSILHLAATSILLKHKSDNYNSLPMPSSGFPLQMKYNLTLYQRPTGTEPIYLPGSTISLFYVFLILSINTRNYTLCFLILTY